MTNLTDFQRQLLTIIRDNPGINSTRLAKKLWPDSKAHNKPLKSGPSGVVKGRGIALSAASHAAKLKKQGWVTDHYREAIKRDRHGQEISGHEISGYKITQAGLEALDTIEVYLTEDEKDLLRFYLIGDGYHSGVTQFYRASVHDGLMEKLDL